MVNGNGNAERIGTESSTGDQDTTWTRRMAKELDSMNTSLDGVDYCLERICKKMDQIVRAIDE